MDAKKQNDANRPPAGKPPKTGAPKDLAKPSDRQSAGPSAAPSERPPSAAASTPKAPGAADPIKELMPAGEKGSRNPTKTRPSTGSGGTSGAEDTTRTAGYVADFARPRDEGPGGPAKPMPTYMDSPEGPPRDAEGTQRPERAQKLPPKPPAAPDKGASPAGPKERKGGR